VYDGAPGALAGRDTPTGRALAFAGPLTRTRRAADGWLVVRGARGHNLRG